MPPMNPAETDGTSTDPDDAGDDVAESNSVRGTVGRRRFLSSAGALAGGTALGSADLASASTPLSTDEGTVPPLEFYYPSGLLDENGQPFLDDRLTAVETTPTAELVDGTAGERRQDDVLTRYPDDSSIPLVAVDDRNLDGIVVGLGGLLVQDGTTWSSGNAQFMLNLWDATTRDTSENETVLMVEPDNNYYYLSRFSKFEQYAERNGYDIVTPIEVPNVRYEDGATFVAALKAGPDTTRESFDAVWLPVPVEFEQPELAALKDFVERGGTVFLQDSSDIAVEVTDTGQESVGVELERVGYDYSTDEGDSDGEDPSRNLNDIADYLGIGFRFNDGLVRDPENNNTAKGLEYPEIPVTDEFNTDRFPWLFEDRDGIAPNDTFYHYVAGVQSVDDGDTFTIGLENSTYASFEVRVLGIDATEAPESVFERPVEWEGLAEDAASVPLIKELQFEAACSLTAPGGGTLTDNDVVAVRAAPTATNDNTDGDAEGFVDYAETSIPLVASGDSVVGLGSLYVNDCADLGRRQEGRPDIEFLQNVWDAYLGGGATVLYDESHAQPKTLDDHSPFVSNSTTSDRNDGFWKADYDIAATDDILADLDGADALWLTPPKEPFTDEELTRLQQFVADDGVVFVHGRADATGEAYTQNLNRVAAAIDAPFRFNSDQVLDTENNGGGDTTSSGDCRQLSAQEKPRTSQFGDRNRFPYFLLRQTAGYGEPYNQPYLASYFEPAKNFAQNEVGDQTVAVELDPTAGVFDGLGRLLCNTYLADEYPDGKTYAQKILEAGLARAYDSGHFKHDEYLKTELEARVADRELWSESDPARSEQFRNRPVQQLYFPQAASVRTADGPLGTDRAPVLAEPTATQNGDPTVTYDDVPLVGVDRSNNVALVGSPLVAENYEIRENDYKTLDFVDTDPFWVNTANFENFVFVTNLLRELTDKEGGSVLFDCGHDQFGNSVDRFDGNYTLALEDARYLERFLEGVGVNCEGIVDIEANLTGDSLVEARALVVSTPVSAFSDAELQTLQEFRDNGGAILFLGSGEAPSEKTALLNEVAAGVGTDLRLNDDQVLDDRHNLKGLSRLPTTTNKGSAFAGDETLFGEASVESWSGPGDGLPLSQEEPPADDPPTLSASGSRSDDGDAFTGGQTNQVKITVGSLDGDVASDTEVTVTDGLPDGWTVDEEYGDVESVEDGSVDLGTVTPSDVEADASVTRVYYAQAPEGATETGSYTFGPAEATATIDGEMLVAEVTGTNTVYVAGASSGT